MVWMKRSNKRRFFIHFHFNIDILFNMYPFTGQCVSCFLIYWDIKTQDILHFFLQFYFTRIKWNLVEASKWFFSMVSLLIRILISFFVHVLLAIIASRSNMCRTLCMEIYQCNLDCSVSSGYFSLCESSKNRINTRNVPQTN